MRLTKRVFCAGIALLSIPLWLAAGERPGVPDPKHEPGTEKKADDEDVPVHEVVVTAAAIIEEDRVTREAERVSVVGEQQIEDLNAQDLTSALRRVPGVTISRYNLIGSYGGGDGGSIFIRGQGSGRPGSEISTMVDGIPRFMGIWSHPLLDNVSIDQADRIEVHKSARPVTHGNMSFASVDITSKRRMEDGFEGRLQGQYGRYNTAIGKLESGGRIEWFDYYVSGSHRESEGHRDRADGQVDAVYAQLGFRPAEHWDLSFKYNHTEGWACDPEALGQAPWPRAEKYIVHDDVWWTTLTHKYEHFEGYIKVYYDNGEGFWEEWDNAFPPPVNTARNSISAYDNYGLRVRETFRPWDGGEVTVGTDWDFYGGRFRQRYPDVPARGVENDILFRNLAPYAMISHAFKLDGLTITPSAGARYNDSKYFDDTWGWQAGLRFDFKETTVFANYAHAFNYTGPYATMQFDTLWGGPPFNAAGRWRDVKPESLDHYEVGLSHRFLKWLKLDVSLFQDDGRDAIRITTPPNPPAIRAVDGYRVRGLEMALTLNPLDNLDLYLGGTLTDTLPDDWPNTPEASGVLGFTYTLHNWRFNMDTQWVGDRHVDATRFDGMAVQMEDYHLVNARVGYTFHLPHDTRLELFSAVENLTDSRYEYRSDYPMPGATWSFGLDFRF